MKRIVVTFRLADRRCVSVNYPLPEGVRREALSALPIRQAAEKLAPVIAARFGAAARVERILYQTRAERELGRPGNI